MRAPDDLDRESVAALAVEQDNGMTNGALIQRGHEELEMHGTLSRRSFILVAAVGMPALAQDQTNRWPSKILKLVVPYPAGGGPDIFARTLARQLSASLGVNVIVENRPGGSGLVGVRSMTSQPADGHTLVLITQGHVTMTALSADFDLLRDTLVVARLANGPLILVVNAASPYMSLSDLIQAAKNKPGGLTYGSAGPGSTVHMATEYLIEMVPGMKALHIPYKGTIEFANAIMATELDFGLGAPGAVLPLIKSGRLRALGTTGRERVEQLPDVPTISEAGASGYSFGAWMGIATHKSTPEPFVKQMYASLAQGVNTDAVKLVLQQMVNRVDLSDSPSAFTGAIERELAKERVAVKRLGLSVQS